ncbi:MAG: exosortase/archaeosortase family protein [Candidatus Aenigmarchaeota archaeon]|nr:exosortase/archaeosortase family protein [Candidatus Aenigmarchaeota archaeon]
MPKRKYNFRDAINFLIILNVLAIPLYVALYTDFSFQPLQDLDAWLMYHTLKIFGYNVGLDGNNISLNSNGMVEMISVSWDSTAWKSMYALASLAIATQILKLSDRLRFALVGIGIIFVLNYIRITTTILASVKFGFDTFDLIHGLLWREGMILAVLVIWILWMRREKYNIAEIK